MNDNAKKQIEELKKIVLELHRSAGDLDAMVQCMEAELESQRNVTYNEMYVKTNMTYRETLKQAKYNNLEERENLAWNALFDALKTEP